MDLDRSRDAIAFPLGTPLRHARPLVVLAFAALVPATVLAPALALTPQDKPAATEVAKPTLPDAKELLSKSVDAVGGVEARAKKKSMEMKGTMEMPGQNLKGAIVSRYLQPNKMLTVVDLPGLGEMRSGYDGAVGWSSSKLQGARLMTPKELETMAREADYMKDVDPLKRYDTVETTGAATIGGFDCWKVKAKKGEETSTLWFEKSTGLARAVAMTIETQLGKMPVTTIFTEYKEFDGIKLPVRTEVIQAGTKIVTAYDVVTFDTVDAAAFELPTEVKALLEPEPAEEDEDEAGNPSESGKDAAKGSDKPAAAPATPAKP
ncbi:MAG: hypothetical protein RIS45_455 [Planctomycetota bacterium]